MTKPLFTHTFALTEPEEQELQGLMEKGMKIIEIVRKGIEFSKIQVEKNG